MLGSRRGRFFVCLVLILLVFSLVLTGCSSSSLPPQDEGNGNGNGDGDENEDEDENEDGEVDFSWYRGTWKSDPQVQPAVEFTVGEFIESVETTATASINYYFKGSIKCSALSGGEQIITEIPTGKIDTIYLSQLIENPEIILLYIRGGYDNEEGGTILIQAWKGIDNNLHGFVAIEDDENSYTTEESPDKFTKISSPLD